MNREEGKKFLFFIALLLIFSLTACTQSPDFELYEGKALKIAVIGEPPEVEEEQVKFNEISFDELTSEHLNSYDAVFITEENLPKAAEGKYANIYLDSIIPFFFISANNHIPFTIKGAKYDESWKWSAGQSYAAGVLKQEDETLKSWGFSLYNDQKTVKHIKAVYSRIFKEINNLNR
jgi:hypothetical protein